MAIVDVSPHRTDQKSLFWLTFTLQFSQFDVHHGNGTEAGFLDRSDVLTISIHQDRSYPYDTGDASVRGEGKGKGFK